MRKLFNTCAPVVLACSFAAAVGGQSPQGASRQPHLVGEVTAFEQAAGRLTVRTDAGAAVTVTTNERTIFRRVPAGETSLERAERITSAEVRAGDRVLIPGGAGGGEAAAVQVVVLARDAAASQRERERDEWRRRGVVGRVVALNAAHKEITIETRGREGAQVVTVSAGEGARLRRFAPDSLRTSDAAPGAFDDIRAGDLLRAHGERSADGSRLTAEEIVSGPVTRVTGVVTATDPARGEITVRNNQTGETRTIVTGQRTTMRRMPREVFEELALAGRQRRAGDAGGRGETAQRGGRNLQQVFESLPAITLGDLKTGDAVVVTGTGSGDTARVTAVALIAGETGMLRWLQRLQRGAPGLGNMSPGLPGTVMGGNTGSNDDDEP